MTTMTLPERAEPARGRTIELVLAHMHLRLGSLALARVELETLAGLAGLDTIGMVDLGEVRWRTGDLLGAGEAAAAALARGADDPIALVIAAEAASSLGRPSEARRFASRAVARAPGTIDAIFAGMPRSNVWAPDANEPAPTAPTLFDRGPEIPSVSHGGEPSAGPTATAQAAAKPAAPVNLGFWDADEGSAGEIPADLDPAREFETGRTALIAGAVDEAAFRFGLALRLAPALAPAVLEATEGARAANLTVVRGDAYRLAGHEPEARLAYAVAANGGLPERRARVRPRVKVRPVTDDDEVVEQPVLLVGSASDAEVVAPNTADAAEAAVELPAVAAEDADEADEAAEVAVEGPTAADPSSDQPPA
jgi:hypothetical protein